MSAETRSDAAQAGPPASSRSLKPQRILACVLCQQRKVKCDRKFPCLNCTKARAQCVPATLGPRRRRRRFPEQELLQRLQKYEKLLSNNNISFEPLKKSSGRDKGGLEPESDDEMEDDQTVENANIGSPGSLATVAARPERDHDPKNIWHAMSRDFRDLDNDSVSSNDDMRETTIKKAWDHTIDNDEHLLFGTRRMAPDLTTSHPDPAQMFRLWQIYLDNVHPLFKITHTPSLQARIVDAIGNLQSVDPTLEALMFSIYCIAIVSLTPTECLAKFGAAKDDLLIKYRSGCQQALSNAGFLRTRNRECLTALFLYLISIRASTVSHSLSAMLGLAVRIAERIGIHRESSLAKFSIFEAEMGRRLWWALVLLDARISETADHKAVSLNPSWDCKIPVNVNDSELRPEMKEKPKARTQATDALFVVIRAEWGEFVRNSSFHLDFNHPSLKPISSPSDGGLNKLEQVLEDRYFRFCDPDNPVHFMTRWTTKGQLAKCFLLEHHARMLGPSTRRNEAQRDLATSFALQMLECDTQIMSSQEVKGFWWFNHLYFPFPAFLQLAQDLRRRSYNESRKAWDIMSVHFEAWFESGFSTNSPFFKIFTTMILATWKGCEAISDPLPQQSQSSPDGERDEQQPRTVPDIVSHLRSLVAQQAAQTENDTVSDPTKIQQHMDLDFDFGVDTLFMSMPTPNSIDSQTATAYNMGFPANPAMFGGPPMYPGMSMPGPLEHHAHLRHRQWAALSGWHGWNGA